MGESSNPQGGESSSDSSSSSDDDADDEDDDDHDVNDDGYETDVNRQGSHGVGHVDDYNNLGLLAEAELRKLAQISADRARNIHKH